MKLSFLEQIDPRDGRASQNLPVGSYWSLLLEIEGEAKTSESLDPAEIGELSIRRGGDPFRAEQVDTLHELFRKWGGTLDNKTGTPGGTQRYVALLPFWLPEFRFNIFDVTDPTNARWSMDFNADHFNQVFGSNALTAKLTALEAPYWSENYLLRSTQRDYDFSGKGQEQDDFSESNVARMVLRDPDDVFDQIQVTRDGSVYVDTVEPDTLLDVTDAFADTESRSSAIYEVKFLTGANLAATLSNSLDFRLWTDGQGTVETTFYRMTFQGANRAQSLDRARRRWEDKGLDQSDVYNPIGALPRPPVAQLR